MAGLRPDTVVCESSTIDPGTVRRLRPLVADRGAFLLDTPVSGSVPSVEAGQLTIMAGGDAAVLERVRPVLDPLAKQVFHVGDLGSGAVMKLAVNAILHGLNLALSESLVLAERGGVARETAYEVFAASAIAAPFVHYKREAFEHPARPRSPSASTWPARTSTSSSTWPPPPAPPCAGRHQPPGRQGGHRRRPRPPRPRRAGHLPALGPGRPPDAGGRATIMAMSEPILFLVDDRPRVLEALARDLGRRFGGDHRIVAEGSPSAAVEALEGLARRGEEVALVVAGQKMAELPGVLFLLKAHELHPGPSGCCWSGGGSGHRPTRPCGP